MNVGDIVGNEVIIEITSIASDEIKAIIISVDSFWSSRPPPNFEIGKQLIFHKTNKDCWVIKDNKLPWFILRPEIKTFNHYR